ncbi:hypothetical protein KAR91_20255 [Candidatus Pacearchaeota archaeon]|nr:hypothetical protein [Candidatus Pacearchaeota archaeon]
MLEELKRDMKVIMRAQAKMSKRDIKSSDLPKLLKIEKQIEDLKVKMSELIK